MKHHLWMMVCGLLLTGCVTRSLTIRTDPPGAMVYVNDQLKGSSPVTYDFTWYGWYRLTLRKDGYQRVDDHKLMRAPVYLWIPFDFLLELFPFQIRDTRTWSYVLTPAQALPTPTPPPESSAESEPTSMKPSDSTAIPEAPIPPAEESSHAPR